MADGAKGGGCGPATRCWSGTYPEEIQLKQSRVSFRALRPSERPCIDGGGKRKRGFYMANGGALEGVAIEGFEIARQTEAGIFAGVGQAKRFVIRSWTVDAFVFSDLWVANLVARPAARTAGTQGSALAAPR